MDTPTTALSRVEAVLQASETGLFLHQIAREAHVNEKEAKEAIKALNARAQIETIPTQGRWGYRYAWLAAKNPLPKVPPPAAPAGQPETRVDTDPEPEAPADSGQESAAEQATTLDDRSKRILATLGVQAVGIAPARWAVAVPKRPLRVVKTRARAEALAMAAVRRGAKSAEVFALTAVGRARRDAVFVETE